MNTHTDYTHKLNYINLDHYFSVLFGKDKLFERLYRNEMYKERIFNDAQRILEVENWTDKMIGSGEIFHRLKQVFEHKENNIFHTTDRNGPGTKEHKYFLEIEASPALRSFEELMFGFFTGKILDEDAFEQIVGFIHRKSAVVGYLYFIKSRKDYMPLRLDIFNKIFNNYLSIDLKLNEKFTWDKYKRFCEVICNVRDYLNEKNNETRVYNREFTLLEAHSFLWMLDFKNVQKPVAGSYKVVRPLALTTFEKLNKTETKSNGSNDKVDYLALSEEKGKIGKKGQTIVLDNERRKLSQIGRPDLTEKVSDVSENTSLGYDIVSFDENGNELFIEVKSSHSKISSFYISRNEIEKSKAHGAKYRIYLVSNVDNDFSIEELQLSDMNNNNLCEIVPISYQVFFKRS